VEGIAPGAEGKEQSVDAPVILGTGFRCEKPKSGEDLNFTPCDYAFLKKRGKDLKVAADDSRWLPKKVQENLLNTLRYLLDPASSVPGTEGVNEVDLFHFHLVAPKVTQILYLLPSEFTSKSDQELKLERTVISKRRKFEEKLDRLSKQALGECYFEPDYRHGYKFNCPESVKKKKMQAFIKAIGQSVPLCGATLEFAVKIKGIAAIYHTFEYIEPSDVWAKRAELKKGSPRRNYITPLETNVPRPYAPPDPGNASSWSRDYWEVLQFDFLVDYKGQVNVLPASGEIMGEFEALKAKLTFVS
jgi:hypothetical protein